MKLKETKIRYVGVKWYREKIIEMINNVENLGTLQYLHRFIELFLEE